MREEIRNVRKMEKRKERRGEERRERREYGTQLPLLHDRIKKRPVLLLPDSPFPSLPQVA